MTPVPEDPTPSHRHECRQNSNAHTIKKKHFKKQDELEAEGKGKRELLFTQYRRSAGDDKVLEMGDGNGCTVK